MSFQDRGYYQNEGGGYGGGGYGLFAGMPSPSPMVKRLLVINIGIFALQFLTIDILRLFPRDAFERLFAATGTPGLTAVQVWRLLTFQFLHANFIHLLFNMLGLFFLGPVLERSWGSRSFIKMYLISGAVGGALYTASNYFGKFHGYLVGASGGVLALLVACAILFPHFRVILVIFPVPIRFAAVLFTIMYLVNVAQAGPNAGGDLCHLGGMVTGLFWVLGRPWAERLRRRHKTVFQQRRQIMEVQEEIEVDRILAKVHQQGIHSLTEKEKEVLRAATEKQKRIM